MIAGDRGAPASGGAIIPARCMNGPTLHPLCARNIARGNYNPNGGELGYLSTAFSSSCSRPGRIETLVLT